MNAKKEIKRLYFFPAFKGNIADGYEYALCELIAETKIQEENIKKAFRF